MDVALLQMTLRDLEAKNNCQLEELKAARYEILTLKDRCQGVEASILGGKDTATLLTARLETVQGVKAAKLGAKEKTTITADQACTSGPKEKALESVVVHQHSMSVDKPCAGHCEYDEGRMYYKIDDDKELKFVLCGLSCGLCEVVFGNNVKDGQHKPTNKTLVFACVSMRNVDHPCKHAVCSSCFTYHLIQSMDSNKIN